MPVNWHFDWAARLYDRVIRPPDTARLQSVLDLPARGWMLDAGGGTGRVAALLCPLVDRLVVTDLSGPMLAQAALKACILPVRSRAERLPFPDGWFARVLVVDAFHHFGDQPGAIRELARVLAPGGRLVIEEPDIRHFAVKLVALAETLALMDSHFRPPARMRDMLSGAGLSARVETADATVWVIGEKVPDPHP